MDCARFADHIEELVGAGDVPDEATEHVAACGECAARLARAREIAALIGARPSEDPPADLADRVRRAAFAARSPVLGRFVKAAAGVLLFAGGCLAAFSFLGGNGTVGSNGAHAYEPLEVRVIKIKGNGSLEETFALEGMFGPDAVMLMADGGDAGNTDGR